MLCAQHGLLLEHVHGGEARAAVLERLHQRPFRNNGRAAGVDDERRGFHARQVGAGHDAAGFRVQRQVQRQDVGRCEKRVPARRGREAGVPGALQRAFPPPADHLHAEGAAHGCNLAADPPIRIDPERASREAHAQRGLPAAAFQLLRFIGDMPQRGEDEAPGELGGGSGIAAAARAHHDASFGARGHIDVRGMRARLADELELRQPFDDGSRKTRALLGEQHRLGAGRVQALGDAQRIPFRIVEHHHLVIPEQREARQFAERILIVVDDRDSHGAPRSVRALL